MQEYAISCDGQDCRNCRPVWQPSAVMGQESPSLAAHNLRELSWPDLGVPSSSMDAAR